ncbi:MAG: hypothetical protein J07AB43_05270 [Candidatus Nanosalina sp. J07AB43]|nr:MAG: hypothetical protein J07AB43_05270 [Candidatus Nanosalina sp. J07AB43]
MITETSIILSGLNAAILASLIYVYAQNYQQLNSKFSLGLLVFASILLLENILAFYFSWTMMGLYAEKVARQGLILRTLESASLIILGYITWRN